MYKTAYFAPTVEIPSVMWYNNYVYPNEKITGENCSELFVNKAGSPGISVKREQIFVKRESM